VKPAAVNWGTFLLVMLLVLGSSSLDNPIASVLIGVTGGLVGCAVGAYVLIKRAKSAQERTFWRWAAAVMLLIAVSFAVAWVLVPGWYRFLLFIPYGAGLFLLVRYGNRRLAEVHREQPDGRA
jgi:hypothetical protein